MYKKIFMKIVPHIVVLAIFLLLTVVYFSPVFFEHKQLPQGDVISAQCWGQDARLYHEQTGEYAHWSNTMFGGMPHNYAFTAPSKSIFVQVSDWVRCGLPTTTAAPFFVYLLGFYVLMLCLGYDAWLCLLGSVAFALASYNIIIISAGHINKCLVIATMPAVLGGVMLCYRKKYIAGILVTIVALGLNVYWSHQQISYYLILMLACLAVAYFIVSLKEKKVKDFFISSAVLLGVAVLSIAPAADKLIPTADYSKESMRGGAVLESSEKAKSGLERDYAFQWSYGVGETMTLLIPNAKGGSSNYPIGEDSETYKLVKRYAGRPTAKQFAEAAPTYWGDQPFTSGPVYAGAIICLLFVLGLLVVEGRERWWLLAAAVIGIVMSWGRNFAFVNDFLFDYLPLYNKFRTPSMALVMTTTAMAILGVMALKQVVDKNVTNRQLYIATGITGGICLLFALFPGIAGNFQAASDAAYPDWLQDTLVTDRRNMVSMSAWRSLLFIAMAFGLIFFYLKNEKFKKVTCVGLLTVLVVIDMWAVDKNYLNNDSFVPQKQELITPTEADKQILLDTTPDYRVLNLATNTFNEAKTAYYHQSIGGYSPAKLRRYQDIIDYYFSRQLNMNVLNMLNTRYVITQQGVQQNPTAMGNCWLVDSIQWVNSPNEEIEAIGTADLQHVAVIDTCWRSKIAGANNAESGTITLINYANPGDLFYESETTEPTLAVFSEVYYKTWHAYIDGVEVPIVRANYILRAIEVPAGKHQIEFRCVDDVLLQSQSISLWSSIVIVAIVVLLLSWLVVRRVRANKKEDANQKTE